MKLGMNIGRETIYKEYKELCFQNLHNYFNDLSLYDLLYRYKKLDKNIFNRMVRNNLNEYFIKYIPKYLSIFSKSKISGELYIGVNDIGNLEGIPYFGKLNIIFIKNLIKNSMQYSRGIDNNIISDKIKDYYYNNINIEIIKLDFFDKDEIIDDLNNTNRLLNSLEESNNIIKNQWILYHHTYNLWQNKIKKYSVKLINLLSNDIIRNEIKDYIIENYNGGSISRLNEILKYFDNNNNYYKNNVFTLEYIQNIINDINHPIRWVINFKDDKLNILKKQKPIPPTYKVNDRIYHLFCNNICNFRSHLYKSNNNIYFYIIRITFNIKDDSLNKYIEYRNINSIKWLAKTRILDNIGEPISI